MPDTMIERVAKHLCAARFEVPVKSDTVEREWHGWMTEARSLLMDMREPTMKMQRAAFAQKVSFRSESGMSDMGRVSVETGGGREPGAATVFTAMIDAALAEEE